MTEHRPTPSTTSGSHRSKEWWQTIAVLIAAVYLYFPVSESALFSPNEKSRVFLTEAIVEHGSLNIDAAVQRQGVTVDLAYFGGHFYTDKAIGLSLGAVPIYYLFWSLSGRSLEPDELLPICRKIVVTLPALLFIAGMLRRYRSRLAGIMILGLALGSSFFPFALSFFGHVPLAFLLFWLFWRAACDAPSNPSFGWHFANGLIAGVAILVDYTGAIFVVLLGLHELAKRRSISSWLCLGVGLTLPLSILFAYNVLTLGHPLDLAYNHMALAGEQPHRAQGFFGIGLPTSTAVWGLTFGAMRGLFVHSPFLLLLFPALRALGRPWRWRHRELLAGSTILAYSWLNASLVDWPGGWSMGPRYLLPIYPFAIVLILQGWQQERRRVQQWYERFAVATVSWAILLHLAAVGTWLHTPTEPLRFATLELASYLLANNQVLSNAGANLGLFGWTSLLPILALGIAAFTIAGHSWNRHLIAAALLGVLTFVSTAILVYCTLSLAKIEKAETVHRVLVALSRDRPG